MLPEKGGPASGLLRSPCFPNWKRKTWLASEREIIFVCCNTHIPYSSPSKHDLSSGFCDKYLQFLIFTISHCANMGNGVLSPHKRLWLNRVCAHGQLHFKSCSTGWRGRFWLKWWFWGCAQDGDGNISNGFESVGLWGELWETHQKLILCCQSSLKSFFQHSLWSRQGLCFQCFIHYGGWCLKINSDIVKFVKWSNKEIQLDQIFETCTIIWPIRWQVQ